MFICPSASTRLAAAASEMAPETHTRPLSSPRQSSLCHSGGRPGFGIAGKLHHTFIFQQPTATHAHIHTQANVRAHRKYPQCVVTMPVLYPARFFFCFIAHLMKEKSRMLRWRASSRIRSIKAARTFGAQKQLGGDEVARVSVYSLVSGANYLLAPLPPKKKKTM